MIYEKFVENFIGSLETRLLYEFNAKKIAVFITEVWL